MLANPLAFLEQTTAAHTGVAGLVLGGEYVVLVSDPAVAKDVLIDRASIFVKVCASHMAHMAQCFWLFAWNREI